MVKPNGYPRATAGLFLLPFSGPGHRARRGVRPWFAVIGVNLLPSAFAHHRPLISLRAPEAIIVEEER